MITNKSNGYKWLQMIPMLVEKKIILARTVPKICLGLWEFFFIKVSKRAAYICEKSFFYKCPKE